MKSTERTVALALRREGVSYQEIRSRLGIAKSTVWRWLKAEGLVENHPQQQTERRWRASQKAARLATERRIERTQRLINEASQRVGALSLRELWLVGITLYWAEGSKQKPTDVSRGIIFSNSDASAIRVFVEWIRQCCGVSRDAIAFEIYLHETADAHTAQMFWRKELDLPATTTVKVYWKRHQRRTNRHNTGDTYHGVMRVRVRRSTILNRRVTGWIQGIAQCVGESAKGKPSDFGSEYPGSIPGSPALFDEEPGAGEAREPRGAWRMTRRRRAYIPYALRNGWISQSP